MPRYKRTRDEAEMDLDAAGEPDVPPAQQETLKALRNMWEFASLMQYIFLFGQVVKIDDDFDIEDLEAECLKPTPSDKLAHIGLQLLKYVSSHRGLTPEIFDEYTRRQYLAKAPQCNPFGEDEEPVKFNDLDVYTRIKILQQLSTWTLGNAERIRGMMPQDEDHLNWRMEPLGWDREDRSYFVLDDNRLYRRTDEAPPPPLPKPKAKPKAKLKSTKSSRTRGTRASKRRKIEDSEDEPEEQAEDVDETMADDSTMLNGEKAEEEEPGFGFTSKTWECIAITLEEYQDFMASIFRSRDPNEKQLRSRIEDDVLPIIEKRAEAIRQKQLKKLRELENLQKMATAKRSSRLAGKAEKEKQEREEREVEEKRQRELKMAHEEQERQRRIEEGHESRRLTREQRVRERETKRILHEEELAKLEEEAERAESQGVDDAADAKRASERQRKTQKEQHKKELEKLAEDDGNWYFDCVVCGKHGENMDDGTHSIACDKCSVWQHSKCHGFSPKQAESDGFTFVCGTCKRKEEDAKKPKLPPLKLHNRASGSPEIQKASSRPTTANGQQSNDRLPGHVARQLDDLASQQPRPSPGPFGQLTNGPSLSPHGQAQGPPGYRYPPVSNFAPHAPQQPWQDSPLPPPRRQTPEYAGPPHMANDYAPPHHQQQHQYAHQSAIASSGGHPGYHQQQYAPHANGYSPRAPAGMYPMAHQHQQQQYYQPPLPPQYNQQHPQQHPQRPESSQLMNGFQSPAKAPAKPISSSPPPQRLQPQGSPSGQSQQPSQQHAQNVQQSPRTNLPPPGSYHRGPAQSPVKSSPQPQDLPPIKQHFSPPRAAQTPYSHHSTANGYQNNQLRTPQHMPGQSGFNDATNASKVAADGMSGPWPEGSSAIPQKHSSPAPPAPVHNLGVGEKKVFPPETPLVPSPHHQAVAGAAGNIPVKKLPEESPKPELSGIPTRPPSHPEIEKQAPSQPPPSAATLPPIQPTSQ